MEKEIVGLFNFYAYLNIFLQLPPKVTKIQGLHFYSGLQKPGFKCPCLLRLKDWDRALSHTTKTLEHHKKTCLFLSAASQVEHRNSKVMAYNKVPFGVRTHHDDIVTYGM